MEQVHDGQEVETKRIASGRRHKARKDDPKFKIKKGDFYEVVTVYGYRVGGDRFIRCIKQVIAPEEQES